MTNKDELMLKRLELADRIVSDVVMNNQFNDVYVCPHCQTSNNRHFAWCRYTEYQDLFLKTHL